MHHYLLLDLTQEQKVEMNKLLLPPAGTQRTFRERVDERGIKIPDWWSDDENDSTEEANVLLAMKMRSPGR